MVKICPLKKYVSRFQPKTRFRLFFWRKDMSKNIKTLLVGDAMIKDDKFVMNWEKYMQEYGNDYIAGMYEADFPSLQKKRLVVEHEGPEQEPACRLSRRNCGNPWICGRPCTISWKVGCRPTDPRLSP